MLIVGLTGGIGSGKSTVARYFSELGAPVIDADEIARTLVSPGSPALPRSLKTLDLHYCAPMDHSTGPSWVTSYSTMPPSAGS